MPVAPKTMVKEPVSEPLEYTVIAPFRDKDNYDVAYEVGATLPAFDKSRIDDLIAKELIQ